MVQGENEKCCKTPSRENTHSILKNFLIKRYFGSEQQKKNSPDFQGKLFVIFHFLPFLKKYKTYNLSPYFDIISFHTVCVRTLISSFQIHSEHLQKFPEGFGAHADVFCRLNSQPRSWRRKSTGITKTGVSVCVMSADGRPNNCHKLPNFHHCHCRVWGGGK